MIFFFAYMKSQLSLMSKTSKRVQKNNAKMFILDHFYRKKQAHFEKVISSTFKAQFQYGKICGYVW